MIGIGAFLDFMKGKWGWAFAGVLFLALQITHAEVRHWRKMFDGEKARHQVTVANYRLAAEKARADDLAHVAAVKAKDDQIAKEKQDALESQLADARAAVARYVERMRGQSARADSGSGAGKDLPAASDPSGGSAIGSGLALVPVGDLDICARNTVLAKGWQDWWVEVSKQPR